MTQYTNREVRKCREEKDDCFAWKQGSCMALTVTDFQNKACPFYKNGIQLMTEWIDREEKLKKAERIDILDWYWGADGHPYCNLGEGVE